MKTLDTLVDDIYALLTKEGGHEISEENLSLLSKGITETIRKRFKRREDPFLRLSAIGKSDCELYYSVNGYDGEKLKGSTLLKFLYGDIIEELILFLARESGHTVTDEQKEVEVDGVKGHIDCKIDGTLVDVKSASTFSFQKFKENKLTPDNDSFGYIDQLSAYATALGEDRAAILAMDKQHGHLTVCPVDTHLYNAEPRIGYLKELTSSPLPPECDCVVEPDGKSGNMKLGVPTSYSGYKHHCFPNARTFIYSTGPRYLVKVEREPNVPEIDKEGNIIIKETESFDEVEGYEGDDG